MIPYGNVGEPWTDRPVALVGSGPSLRGFDYEQLRSPLWRVIAVNQAVWNVPWADACVSIDIEWIRDHAPKVIAELPAVAVFLGPPDRPHPITIPGATHLRRRRTHGFSDDPGAIEMGGTSGYAALNFAYLKRVHFAALFGFDYSTKRGDHADDSLYPWHPKGHNGRYWERWAMNFNEAFDQISRAGMSVFNASHESSIPTFPLGTVAEGVTALREVGEAYAKAATRKAVHAFE